MLTYVSNKLVNGAEEMDLMLIETVKLTSTSVILILKNIRLVPLVVGLQKEMGYGVRERCPIFILMPVKTKL